MISFVKNICSITISKKILLIVLIITIIAFFYSVYPSIYVRHIEQQVQSTFFNNYDAYEKISNYLDKKYDNEICISKSGDDYSIYNNEFGKNEIIDSDCAEALRNFYSVFDDTYSPTIDIRTIDGIKVISFNIVKRISYDDYFSFDIYCEKFNTSDYTDGNIPEYNMYQGTKLMNNWYYYYWALV